MHLLCSKYRNINLKGLNMSIELEGVHDNPENRYINKKVEHRIKWSGEYMVVEYRVYSSLELIQLLLSFKSKIYFLRCNILYTLREDELKAYTDIPTFEVSRRALIKATRKQFFSFLELRNNESIEIFLPVQDYGYCIFIG